MLQVWVGNFSFLEKLDTIVKDFIWSDQDEGKKARMEYMILLLSLEDGGLGLIPIKLQIIALAGKTTLWIVSYGDHTL